MAWGLGFGGVQGCRVFIMSFCAFWLMSLGGIQRGLGGGGPLLT